MTKIQNELMLAKKQLYLSKWQGRKNDGLKNEENNKVNMKLKKKYEKANITKTSKKLRQRKELINNWKW